MSLTTRSLTLSNGTRSSFLAPHWEPQVFKLYVFSRSVHSFVEILQPHFEGEGEEEAGADDTPAALIKKKFLKGFSKLSEGFLLFQQVRRGGQSQPSGGTVGEGKATIASCQSSLHRSNELSLFPNQSIRLSPKGSGIRNEEKSCRKIVTRYM